MRDELASYLSELETDDPTALWHDERQRGLASGVDQVFHFFFDDHDFDKSAVGYSLYDQFVVRLIKVVKLHLEAILRVVGDADDDDFVSHPLWADVRRAAAVASSRLKEAA
ncbi:SCO4402 family protein [Novosphingobium sp.]|uniref:SCO4402 family protein n=1 Tax=Novosphingobium sp. TaxID=1874826 RepID=UPI0038B837C5